MVEISINTQSKQIRDRLSRLKKMTGDFGRSRLIVGTSREYMVKHQLGLDGLPKREFLGVNKADELQVVKIIDSAIANPKSKDADASLKNIGEYMLMVTDDRFDRETGPDGLPWKPNTPFTIRQKKAARRILKVLQSTGQARSSIQYQIRR